MAGSACVWALLVSKAEGMFLDERELGCGWFFQAVWYVFIGASAGPVIQVQTGKGRKPR